MRTKKHYVREISAESKEFFEKMFPDTKNSERQNNRLLNNIEAGHLPSKNKMETFLKKTEEWFLKQDWENDFKTESGLNSVKCEVRL